MVTSARLASLKLSIRNFRKVVKHQPIFFLRTPAAETDREKGFDCFSKWNVFLAIARNGENRSHECTECTLLSDHAIRSGSACGDNRLELYDPDAGVVKPTGHPLG
jgi:hypothetical protein